MEGSLRRLTILLLLKIEGRKKILLLLFWLGKNDPKKKRFTTCAILVEEGER